MSIAMVIETAGRYIETRFVGVIQDSDILEAYEGFYERNAVPLNLGELCDFVGADLRQVTQPGLARFAVWLQDLYDTRGESLRRTAYLMPGIQFRSKLVMFESMMMGTPEITRTFTRREEAIAWLLDSSAETATMVPTR